MSTRAAIAVNHDGTPQGRYLHHDGYPTGAGAAIHLVVARDGLDTARHVLTEDWHGWNSLNPDEPHQETASARSRVAGYGTPIDNHPDDWWTPVQSLGLAWAYLLADDGLQIYTVTHGHWRPIGEPVPWNLTPELLVTTLTRLEDDAE